MRIPPLLAGVAAGTALAVGGAAAIDLVTTGAEAQAGDPVNQADLAAANQRSQAAINGYKNLSNRLGKFVNEPGQLVGARSGPITQDRGVSGGLPTSVIADGAITSAKLAPGVLTQASAAGATGPQGPAGPAGPQGSAGLADVEVVLGVVVNLGSGTSTLDTVSCPAGKVAIGGGALQTDGDGNPTVNGLPPANNLSLVGSGPDPDAPGTWLVQVMNAFTGSKSYQARAICAKVDP